MGHLGEDVSDLVQMTFPELDNELAKLATRPNETGNVNPRGVVDSDVNRTPMVTKPAKSVILFGFVVALLGVALDAHRLIVPERVAAFL